MASFDSASFDTQAFSELAWFFDAVENPGGRRGGSTWIQIGPDPILQQQLREDDELLELVAMLTGQDFDLLLQ